MSAAARVRGGAADGRHRMAWRIAAGRRGSGAAAVALAALVLTGCSQLAALAPVGGDGLAEVRYGAIDVLLDSGVDVLEAPVCVAGVVPTGGPAASSGAAGPDAASGATAPAADAEATPVTCSGTTVAGEAIAVTSSTAADATLTVSVGGEQLYSGPLWTVLDEAARP